MRLSSKFPVLLMKEETSVDPPPSRGDAPSLITDLPSSPHPISASVESPLSHSLAGKACLLGEIGNIEVNAEPVLGERNRALAKAPPRLSLGARLSSKKFAVPDLRLQL